MKYFKLLLLCLVSFSLYAKGKSPEMVIELRAQNPLTAVFIEAIKMNSNVITEKYPAKLQEVLFFDFNYNGRTSVFSFKKDEELKDKREAKDWRGLGVSYLIIPKIEENYLIVSVLSTKTNEICFAKEYKLSGHLGVDRRMIHQFAHDFHKEAFGEEGIYLSKLLYTYKEREVPDSLYSTVSEEVYECDWDGANPKQLTFENSHCVTPHPVFSKNGEVAEGFFYVSYKIGQPKIYWLKFDKQEPLRLSYIPGNQFMPCISKQGDKVVFINDAPGNPEVFMQDFKPGIGSVGKPRQIFACRRAVQASPTFSPDGKHIAFVSDKEGPPKIYVMPIPREGTRQKDLKPVLITKKNRENTKPCWSPDGTKIAYISRVDGIRQVWIYDFIKNEEWQLTFGGGNKENPHWAHNNLHIAFNSVGSEGSSLYLVNLNQAKPLRLKQAKGIQRFPVWIKKDKI